MPLTTVGITLLIAATLFSSYIVGRQDGQRSCKQAPRKKKKSTKPVYKRTNEIEDNRAAMAKVMHRGELIKWCIKTWPKKAKTPFRNMRKADLIKLYTNWSK